MSEPVIAVLTNERDFAADHVIRHLDGRGVQLHRLNIESARNAPVEPWSPDTTLPRPDVIWWRQFEADDHPSTLAEVDDVLVERAQWRVWVSTLASSRTIWVNDLWAARRAENKVEQLRAAHAVGFQVPPTVITNDPAAAKTFRDSVGPCVVKTLSSGYFAFSDQSFVFTELLDQKTLRAAGWYGVPIIVQKLVAAGLDARVISFGGHCFGARCRSRGIDWRKTPFEPDLWERWTIPASIEKACLAYRARLGLEYVAFDFMLNEGSVEFLEANQAGEWVFLDRTLDLGIARELADRMVQLAHSVDRPVANRSLGDRA